jgi:hypothetical protein
MPRCRDETQAPDPAPFRVILKDRHPAEDAIMIRIGPSVTNGPGVCWQFRGRLGHGFGPLSIVACGSQNDILSGAHPPAKKVVPTTELVVPVSAGPPIGKGSSKSEKNTSNATASTPCTFNSLMNGP